MVTPIVGLKVYNFVPSDFYKCHIGEIAIVTSTEFIVKYTTLDGESKERVYPIGYIRHFKYNG